MTYVKTRRRNAYLPERRDKLCKLCASMAHRVEGPICDECELKYKAREPLTLDYVMRQAGREAK